MPRYAARRALSAAPMLLAVAAVSFLLMHLAPGDPVYLLAGEGGTPEHYAQVRRQLGLDRPLFEQLLRHLWQVAQGDLGRSIHQRQPVLGLIVERLPATLLLVGSALGLASVGGALLGVWAASRPRSLLDRALLAFTALGAAVPVFWSGLLLVVCFSLWLGWFPAQGMASPRTQAAGWVDVLHHLMLPALALGLQPLASLSRLMRLKVLEALSEPYVLTARAKGLPRARVLGHAVRNALLPVITVIGGSASMLITGAVLTETVFAWPGLGRLALDATLTRDYPLIMGTIMVAAAGTVVLNLLTDVAYAVVDPRITYG
ncbi:MAG: ABC transporter permease [Armatimonadota bacterium]|nr:ABC transporter permease [Armatimonadota bacterium]MDR7535383.1 ABC transporter permease [Armatimonadota bacterium]